MKIVVTGASGFIGKNLILSLPSSWQVFAIYHSSADFPQFIRSSKLPFVNLFHCDLTDKAGIHRFTKEHGQRFDVCVYLAANGNPAVSVEDPLLDLNANTTALVQFLNQVNVKRMIYFSSGAVYDGLKGKISPQKSLDPHLPYAISKYAAEQYVKSFHKKGTIQEYVNVRFFGAYGPYEPERKIYTQLIKTFHINGKNAYTVRGNGKNFIDAMYVDDAIRAIHLMIKSKKKDLTIDCCSGRALSINDLVRCAARVFDVKDLKIHHQGCVPEYNDFQASPQAMEKIFGFKPKVTLEDGLSQFAKFLKER